MSDEGAPATVPRAALGGLGAGYGLSREQLGKLSALLGEIERDEHAPTGVREAERAADVHVADSLIALELAAVRTARSLADVGSGAGFPGLVLAVALPAAQVSLVESRRRACAFLERARARAAIGNAQIVCMRAEEWGEGAMRNDLVLARALGPQPVVLEYAAPLLRVGGVLVDWRGRRCEDEERAAAAAAAQLGLRRTEIRRVEPFVGAKDRHLHVFEKVDQTPARFPRRAGVARKRPLGGGQPSDRVHR